MADVDNDDIEKNGGSAFPTTDNRYTDGMTLRDWFAGQALAGMCVNPEWNKTEWWAMADNSYVVADAMLKARQS